MLSNLEELSALQTDDIIAECDATSMLTVGTRRVLQGQLRFKIISTLSWARRSLLGTNDCALRYDDFW